MTMTKTSNQIFPMTTTTQSSSTPLPHRYRYEATGVVANARLGPLLPEDWQDVTKSSKISHNGNDSNGNSIVPDFLWENAPRNDTKLYRDDVQVYSHLPNGSAILDSK